jgi:hypothetical protein
LKSKKIDRKYLVQNLLVIKTYKQKQINNKMKALYYIFGVALLTLASCSSGLYVGTEYDDLYYQNSDKPVTRVNTQVSRQVTEGDLKSGAYYDNMYAADTLVSKEYSDAVDYNDAGLNNNYYDNYSYAGRLNRFYGNYFNPYWRDPFYSSWYPSFGLNFYGGSPYSYGYGYDPLYYDYYDPFSYGYGYGYGYGGFYNNYYYGGLYNRYYNPFYGSYNYPYSYGGYNSYSFNDGKNVSYVRRERPSTLSTRWSGGASSPVASGSRRSTDIATGAGSSRSSFRTDAVSASSRRTANPAYNSQQTVAGTERKLNQDPSRSSSESVSGTQSRRAVTARPEYNSVNRTYTPSYSDPKMSTRPSYNNTRVNSNSNQYNNNSRTNSNINNSNINTNRSIPVQRNQSYSGSSRNGSSYSSQGRSGSSYSNSGSYSVPSRRSSGGGSYSSGSSSSGSSRSSYSGGSSSSGSYSSGSSGSSSSHSSSSGSSSGGGGGRRH